MCEVMTARLAAVEKNWEADKLVLVAILFSSYTVHALPQTAESFAVLEKCRKISIEWIRMINTQTLNTIIQTGTQDDIKEIQTRLAFIALCVILSFDAPLSIDGSELMNEEAALDFQLALRTLQDNTTSSSAGNFRAMQKILNVDRVNMLMTKAHQVIAFHLDQVHKLCTSTSLLSAVVEKAFESVTSQWIPLKQPWQRYSVPKEDYYWTIAKNNSVIQIGVADGVFLVDGAPPQRLPSSIEESPIYKRTFGNYIFMVVPKGTGFISKDAYYEFDSMWEFSNHNRKVAITEHQHKSQDGSPVQRKLQLLPQNLFEKELQHDLVANYAHWYCEEDHVIEFRCINFAIPEFVKPVYQAELLISKRNSGAILRDIHLNSQYSMNGPLFQSLMKVFQRLDEPTYIHMYEIGEKVAIRLLRLGLDFELVGDKIQSVQFSDYIVCHNQYLDINTIAIISNN